MPGKRLNPRLAKIHRTYTVEEIARLYGMHRNSVRNWMKSGLTPIDDARPLLVRGADLRAFLARRRQSGKRPCPPGMLYCFRCRAPRHPALGMLDFMDRRSGAGNAAGLCEACGTMMNRRAHRGSLRDLFPDVDVQFPQAEARIEDCQAPCADCAEEKEITA